MALSLPPLPKLLDVAGIRQLEELARRTGEWARAAQDLLRGLREASSSQDTRIRVLEGAGGSVSFGTPGSIQPDDAVAAGSASTAARSDHTHGIVAAAAGAATPGDAAAEGVATSFARSDHKHSLAAFGSSAGTFCQGNDSRLSDSRTPTAHHTSHEAGGSDKIKLDDLEPPDDTTDLDASTSKHGLLKKLPNDATTFLNGAGSFVTPGIGGSQIWFPDAPPASAHSKDDEFDGNSLDAKWTTWDKGSTGATFTVDTTRKMFKLVQPAGTGVRFCGIYQAVPASEFVVYAKVSMSFAPTTTGGAAIGLMVGDDLSVGTSDFRELDVNGNTTTHQISTRTWTAWNGTSSAVSTRPTISGYLRMRVNGTACASDFSIDGIGWHQIVTITLGFTPVHFGICGGTSDTGAEVTGWVHFFRVFSGAGSSAYQANSIGRYV